MKLGIIGAGNMGGAMLQRLLEHGHDVAVCDLDPMRVAQARAAGAFVAARPAALAGCELVIVAVVNGAQTHEVLFGEGGVAAALAPGSCVMLCPTIAPADVQACALALAERGVACIDAPMSGGPTRARAGTMSLMVACEDAVYARWLPLLQTLATRLFRISARCGDGARTKLVNNLLAAANLASAAEALALAARLGLEPALTLAVIEQSSGQSWIGSERLQRALATERTSLAAGVERAPLAAAAERTPLAHMSLLAKDSVLALDEARGAGITLPVSAAAAATFARALAAGLANEDDSALWRWIGASADDDDGLEPPARAPERGRPK